MTDEQALLDQQAKELQALRDYRKAVRNAYEIVDESAKKLPRDTQIAVDGAALRRLGLLIEFGGSS